MEAGPIEQMGLTPKAFEHTMRRGEPRYSPPGNKACRGEYALITWEDGEGH